MSHDIIKTLDDIYLTASYGSEEDPSSAPQALLRIGDLALKALREIDPTRAASELRTKAEPSVTEAMVDEHLEAILRAAGTTFRHYTMHETRQRMRVAMRAALLAAMAEGAR